MWNIKKPLTVLDVINNELERLHDELSQYIWTKPETADPEYSKLLDEISKINNHLIELSKEEFK